MLKRSTLSGALLAVSMCVASFAGAGAATAGELKFKPLNLLNGWVASQYSSRKPSYAVDSDGVVHFKGAIEQDTAASFDFAFKLPAKLRPKSYVYIHTDMFGASSGRIYFNENGEVYVQAEADTSKAQMFTSLEGLTYVP